MPDDVTPGEGLSDDVTCECGHGIDRHYGTVGCCTRLVELKPEVCPCARKPSEILAARVVAARADAERERDAEAVEVVRGFVTYDDGSRSPVERWVRASDDRWVSLDSERQNACASLTWVMDDPAALDAGGEDS